MMCRRRDDWVLNVMGHAFRDDYDGLGSKEFEAYNLVKLMMNQHQKKEMKKNG